MSASLKTTNYELPYFAENDITDWSVYDDAVIKIDTILKHIADAGEVSQETLNEVVENLKTLTRSVENAQTTINQNTQDITNVRSAITLINQLDSNQNLKINTLEEKVEEIDTLQTQLTMIESKLVNTATINFGKTPKWYKTGATPLEIDAEYSAVAFITQMGYNYMYEIFIKVTIPPSTTSLTDRNLLFKINGINSNSVSDIIGFTITSNNMEINRNNIIDLDELREMEFKLNSKNTGLEFMSIGGVEQSTTISYEKMIYIKMYI